MVLFMVLIYVENNKGPKIERCETPYMFSGK